VVERLLALWGRKSKRLVRTFMQQFHHSFFWHHGIVLNKLSTWTTLLSTLSQHLAEETEGK
jgi:hypothetical protein